MVWGVGLWGVGKVGRAMGVSVLVARVALSTECPLPLPPWVGVEKENVVGRAGLYIGTTSQLSVRFGSVDGDSSPGSFLSGGVRYRQSSSLRCRFCCCCYRCCCRYGAFLLLAQICMMDWMGMGIMHSGRYGGVGGEAGGEMWSYLALDGWMDSWLLRCLALPCAS